MLFAIEGNASGSKEGFFARGWAAACVACARQELAGAWRQRERMPGMGTRAAAGPAPLHYTRVRLRTHLVCARRGCRPFSFRQQGIGKLGDLKLSSYETAACGRWHCFPRDGRRWTSGLNPKP